MTYSLWDEAARDINEEASLRTQASTRVASRDLMPFIALALTEAELEHRLALAEGAISTVAASAGVSPSDVETHLRSQWALLAEAKGDLPWDKDDDGDVDSGDSDAKDSTEDDGDDDSDDGDSDDSDGSDADSDDDSDDSDDSDDDDDDSKDDNPFGKSGSRLPFEGSQVTAGGDTWRSHTIDDPDGQEYKVAPKEHADALNARFEQGSGPVVWHPTKPNTLIHDPNNFWDGPRHVTVHDDGSYGYSGYHGDETFDASGKTLTQNGKPYSPAEPRGICPDCAGHGRVVSPDGKFDTGCQTCRGEGTVSVKMSSKTASGDDDEDTQCNAIVHSEGYGPNAINPPEYCENDVVPGTEYCANHTDHSDRYASLKTGAANHEIAQLGHGDSKTFIRQDGKEFTVSYHEHQPDGDDGYPARGYKAGRYTVETPEGYHSSHAVSPFNDSGSMQRQYGADQAYDAIMKGYRPGKTAINDAEMSQYSSEVANGHSNPPAGECESCGEETRSRGHKYCTDCEDDLHASKDDFADLYNEHRSQQQHESDPYDRHADAMDRYRTYSLDSVRAMVREGKFDVVAECSNCVDDSECDYCGRKDHCSLHHYDQEDFKTAAADSPYCPTCKGGGTHPWDASKNCPKCKGSGLKPKPKKSVEDATGGEALASLNRTAANTCPRCHGNGRSGDGDGDSWCRHCDGNGVVNETEDEQYTREMGGDTFGERMKAINESVDRASLSSLRQMVSEGKFDRVAQNESPNVPQPKAEARESGPAVAGGGAAPKAPASDLDFEPTSGTQASRREQVIAAMASQAVKENPSLSVKSALALATETADKFPSVVAEWNAGNFRMPGAPGDGPLTGIVQNLITDTKGTVEDLAEDPLTPPDSRKPHEQAPQGGLSRHLE
jgi:DnaJ-class molecular chaperone